MTHLISIYKFYFILLKGHISGIIMSMCLAPITTYEATDRFSWNFV